MKLKYDVQSDSSLENDEMSSLIKKREITNKWCPLKKQKQVAPFISTMSLALTLQKSTVASSGDASWH